jgi:ABC-type multidrug transport system ATPase subunit
MRVRLEQAGKRFEGRTIFRNADFEFGPGDRCLISGPNGAGKSTFLKLVAGYLRPSEGTVEHLIDGSSIDAEQAYRYIAMAAPYLRFPSDLSVMENIWTWERFRSLRLPAEEVPGMVKLEEAKHRPVRELSSGMEQRLKLGIAFASHTPLLLLDEPLTNIDAEGRELYHHLLEKEADDRGILVCSNDPDQEGAPNSARLRIEAGELRTQGS